MSNAPAAPVDDLMAELNGDTTTKISNVDVMPETPRPDPLVVAPTVAPSPAVKLDAAHSTAAGGKGYAVTVKGEFYAPAKDAPGKKITKPYEVTINLPSLDMDGQGALSVIKNKLLDQVLRKKHAQDGYLGFRSHEIVKAVPLGNSPAVAHLQYMDRAALEKFIADNRVPILPALYPDVAQLRQSVMDYAQNPKNFEKREAERQADLKQRAELLALNPDLA
jgi:hypothetical protein